MVGADSQWVMTQHYTSKHINQQNYFNVLTVSGSADFRLHCSVGRLLCDWHKSQAEWKSNTQLSPEPPFELISSLLVRLLFVRLFCSPVTTLSTSLYLSLSSLCLHSPENTNECHYMKSSSDRNCLIQLNLPALSTQLLIGLNIDFSVHLIDTGHRIWHWILTTHLSCHQYRKNWI